MSRSGIAESDDKSISSFFLKATLVDAPVCTPTNNEEGFPFPTSNPAFIAFLKKSLGYSNWSKMKSQFSFNLYFLDCYGW